MLLITYNYTNPGGYNPVITGEPHIVERQIERKRWMDGLMEGWMDGWLDGRMDGYISY